MDFKQLRSFVTVADCGSFTQAAVRLYTSQPTVSAHIRQLEDELHETLFLRTTKSLTITARGQELYDYAVHVLELQDQLLDAWAQDEHTIRLGASTIPSAYILPEVLPPFRAQHPDAVFSVLQSDSAGVLQQLRAGRFELGFAGAQEQSPELVFLPFFRDRMVLITPNTPHFAKLLQDGTPVKSILEREPLAARGGERQPEVRRRFFGGRGLEPAHAACGSAAGGPAEHQKPRRRGARRFDHLRQGGAGRLRVR